MSGIARGLAVSLLAVILVGFALPAEADDCGEQLCPPPSGVKPGEASFVGTIFQAGPGGRAHSFGAGAAGCDGCIWVKVASCPGNQAIWDPVTGQILVVDDHECGQSQCAAGGQQGNNLWLFLRRPGEMAFRRVTDEVCVTPGRPIVTGQQIADEVARYVSELPVPTPVFEIQPKQIRVVHKDVIFLIRPDRHRPVTGHRFQAFGITITLDAKPTYVWDFDTASDDGRTLETDSPGHRWPNQDVTTRYQQKGEYGVQVAARWAGTYVVSGIDGEQTVVGPEVSSAVVPVAVREARAVLYDD
jgi:hypothetical protein